MKHYYISYNTWFKIMATALMCLLLSNNVAFSLSPPSKFWAKKLQKAVKDKERGDVTYDFGKSFINRIASQYVITILAKYLDLGISEHTAKNDVERDLSLARQAINEIKDTVEEGELEQSKIGRDMLLHGFELDKLYYREDAFYLPVYRDGVKAYEYKFYKDGNKKTADMVIPVGGGTIVYVDVLAARAQASDNGKDAAKHQRIVQPTIERSTASPGKFYLINTRKTALAFNNKYEIFDKNSVAANVFPSQSVQKHFNEAREAWRFQKPELAYEDLVSFFVEHVTQAKELGAVPVLIGETHLFSLPFYAALRQVYGLEADIISLDDHTDCYINQFSNDGFWAYGVMNGKISPKRLTILGVTKWQQMEDDPLIDIGITSEGNEDPLLEVLQNKGVKFTLEENREYKNVFLSFDADVSLNEKRLAQISKKLKDSGLLGIHIAEIGYSDGYSTGYSDIKDPGVFSVSRLRFLIAALSNPLQLDNAARKKPQDETPRKETPVTERFKAIRQHGLLSPGIARGMGFSFTRSTDRETETSVACTIINPRFTGEIREETVEMEDFFGLVNWGPAYYITAEAKPVIHDLKLRLMEKTDMDYGKLQSLPVSQRIEQLKELWLQQSLYGSGYGLFSVALERTGEVKSRVSDNKDLLAARIQNTIVFLASLDSMPETAWHVRDAFEVNIHISLPFPHIKYILVPEHLFGEAESIFGDIKDVKLIKVQNRMNFSSYKSFPYDTPDYESAIRNITNSDPDRAFCAHIVRLPTPKELEVISKQSRADLLHEDLPAFDRLPSMLDNKGAIVEAPTEMFNDIRYGSRCAGKIIQKETYNIYEIAVDNRLLSPTFANMTLPEFQKFIQNTWEIAHKYYGSLDHYEPLCVSALALLETSANIGVQYNLGQITNQHKILKEDSYHKENGRDRILLGINRIIFDPAIVPNPEIRKILFQFAFINSIWPYMAWRVTPVDDWFPEKSVKFLKDSVRNDPALYADLLNAISILYGHDSSLLDLLEKTDDTFSGPVSPEKERAHATRTQDQLKLTQADKEKQVDFIALDTSWIKGYEEGAYLQYDALNPLVVDIRNYCKRKGIEFIDGDRDTVIQKVGRLKQANSNARGIILGDVKTVDMLGLDDDENVFLAGIDNKHLTIDSYIRLMEMLALTLELFRSPLMDEKYIQKCHPHLGFKQHSNTKITFELDAEPVDYEVLREIYEIQRFA